MKDYKQATRKAIKRFLKENPKYNVSQLKGRGHIERDTLKSADVNNMVIDLSFDKKIDQSFLCESISQRFGGFVNVFPRAFVKILAEEMGIPYGFLTDGVDN